jgi:hypothetical protein
VLAQFSPGRPLTEADLRYLHQTHGLPPELVTDLLGQGDDDACLRPPIPSTPSVSRTPSGRP